MSTSWNNIGGSLIGSEVLVAWPSAYPTLRVRDVWSPDDGSYTKIADKCIVAGLIDVKLRSVFGGSPLFRKDPIDVAVLARGRGCQRATVPDRARRSSSKVSPTRSCCPGSNAAYVEAACAAGATLTADFIGDLGHMTAGFAGAPLAFTFFQQRFAGVPAGSTCGTELPVAPLAPPKGT